MKIKTNELIGEELDWAVSSIEEPLLSRRLNTWKYKWNKGLLRYSVDWGLAGPIIDREGISIVQEAEYGWWQAAVKVQLGSMFGTDLCGSHRQEGPTALIAAMRCYTASKLGDEVEIPEELCQQQSS